MPESLVRLLLIEDNPGDADLIRELLDSTSATRFRLSQASRLAEGDLTIDEVHEQIVEAVAERLLTVTRTP